MDDPSHAYLSYLDTEMTETTQDTETARFIIDNDERCSWALRKIGALESDKAKRTAFVQGEIERLHMWKAQEDAKAQRSIDHFTAMLRGYVDILKAQGVLSDKRRSYKLPQGTLQLRAAPVDYGRDDPAIIHWLQAQGGTAYLRTKTELAWEDLKKKLRPILDQANADVVLTDTGEVIPGLRVIQPSREIFSVKVEGT